MTSHLRKSAEEDLKKKNLNKIFETTNLDLGAFLMLHGVEYVGSRVEYDDSSNKKIAIMQFLDEKQNARDLERVFMVSSEKRFRDLNKYLLKEAHKAIRDKEHFNVQ